MIYWIILNKFVPKNQMTIIDKKCIDELVQICASSLYKKGKEVIQSKLNMDKNVDLLKENKDKETTTFR
jgi:hypothetical protein